MEMLNQLRRRAYGRDPKVPDMELDYKLSDYKTMDEFIDLLIKEETYEHFNEGKHWDFIVRLGKAQELVGKYYNVEDGRGQTYRKDIIYGRFRIPNSTIIKR